MTCQLEYPITSFSVDIFHVLIPGRKEDRWGVSIMNKRYTYVLSEMDG